MCVGLLERSCILTMIYKKRIARRSNSRYWDHWCSSLFARLEIILDIFNYHTRETPATPLPSPHGGDQKKKGGQRNNVEREVVARIR